MEDPRFPYFSKEERFLFPKVSESTPEGIVASGGNLSPGMLISAYTQGIFPWYSPGEPVLWWAPDPRFVLRSKNLHISKSLKKTLKQERFTVTFDADFSGVIEACREVPRRGQSGTWITGEMIEGYTVLHELGLAHSVEVRQEARLVGGLYGVSLGRCFFGESMFSTVSDASKTALVFLVRRLGEAGFEWVDSQVYTAHLDRMGAEEIAREEYMRMLREGLEKPDLRGDWGELFPVRGTSVVL